MNNTQKCFQSACIYKASRKMRVEEECTLPDYCSDISRIIKTDAVPCITSKKVYVRDGQLFCDISGKVYFNIIYRTDNGGTESYFVTSELFDSSKTDVSDVDADSVFAFASVTTESSFCKVQSPRRISVRADICLNIDVRANSPFDFYEKGSDTVETVEKQAEVMQIMSFKDEEIRLTEEIKLPKSCPPMERILYVGLSVSLENAKASDNGVSYWGNAGISCIYIPEEGWDSGIHSFYQPIEVKGSIETEDSISDAAVVAELLPVGVEYEILTDSLGENRILKADICYSAHCLVEESCPITLTEDIYGVGCKVTPIYEKGELRKYIGTLREDTAIREKLPLKREFSEVEGVESKVTLRDTHFENGELYADCRVNISGIGVAEDDLSAISEVFDISVRLNLPAEVSGMSEGLGFDMSQWTGFTDASVSGDELSVSFDLMTLAHIYKSVDATYVTDVSIEAQDTHSDETVFCYPCDTDTLWTVGKRYGVGIRELAEANSIAVGDKPKRVMLIP
ncbi:MAG: hypothetical protein E7613_06950 [Ruminococcaceae bacterium]|nr:hypothetical protein [Oscillospiraceae bacterium]